MLRIVVPNLYSISFWEKNKVINILHVKKNNKINNNVGCNIMYIGTLYLSIKEVCSQLKKKIAWGILRFIKQ